MLAFAIATLTLALVATAAFADEQRKARATLTGYEGVAAMRAGDTYAYVHSTAFPGGEIRGQINDKTNDRIDRGDQGDD